MDNIQQSKISPFNTVPYKIAGGNNLNFISEYTRFLSDKNVLPVPNPTNKVSKCNVINIPPNVSDESKENLQLCPTSSVINTNNKLTESKTNCEVQQINEPKSEELDKTLKISLERLPKNVVTDLLNNSEETTVEELPNAPQSDTTENDSKENVSNEKLLHLLIKPSYVLLKRLDEDEINRITCIKEAPQENRESETSEDIDHSAYDTSVHQVQLPEFTERIKEENDTTDKHLFNRNKCVSKRPRKTSFSYPRKRKTPVPDKTVEQTTETSTDSQLQTRPDCSSRLSLPQESSSSPRKRTPSAKLIRFKTSNDLLSSYLSSRRTISDKRHKGTLNVTENESRKLNRRKENASGLQGLINIRRRQTEIDTAVNKVKKKRRKSTLTIRRRKLNQLFMSNEITNTQETNTTNESALLNVQPQANIESVKMISNQIKQKRKYRRRKTGEIQDQQWELKLLKRARRQVQQKAVSRKMSVQIQGEQQLQINETSLQNEGNSCPLPATEITQLSTDNHQENQSTLYHENTDRHVSKFQNGVEDVTSFNTVDNFQVQKNKIGGKRVYRRRNSGMGGRHSLNTSQYNGFENHKRNFNSRTNNSRKEQTVKCSRQGSVMPGVYKSNNDVFSPVSQVRQISKDYNKELDSENCFTSFVIIDSCADQEWSDRYRKNQLKSIRAVQKYAWCDGDVPMKSKRPYKRKNILHHPETLAALAMRAFFGNKL